jgi:hypothetical protein
MVDSRILEYVHGPLANLFKLNPSVQTDFSQMIGTGMSPLDPGIAL